MGSLLCSGIRARSGRSLLAASLALVVAGPAACGGDSSATGPCSGVECSGHGTCAVQADEVTAYCQCADGYHPVGVGLDCAPDDVTNPCNGVSCSGHGTCRVDGTRPVCDCASGYERDPSGLLCFPVAAADADADGDANADVEADADADADVDPDAEAEADADAEEAADPDADADADVEADAEEEADVGPDCGNGTVDGTEECDDGNAVAGDGCESTCLFSCHAAADCEELPDNPCTTDTCVTVSGGQACAREDNTGSCDDANVCTAADTCGGGTCAGTPIDADGDTYGPGPACGGDCEDGIFAVNPGAVEACNAVDDNCDALTDETFTCAAGVGRACATGCGSTGRQTCSASCAWGSCTPPAETCNGADDDCDGACDDGFACCAGTTGSCPTACGSTGSRTCSGTCTWGACTPPGEVCTNSLDDDCNGCIDEGCRGRAVPCSSDAPCTGCGLVCNENWGICVVASCTGRDDFTACETVTTPDRSYDICVDGACVSPGCGDATCNVPGPHFPIADTGQRVCCGDDFGFATCPGTPGTVGCETTAFCGQDAQYGWDTTHAASERFTRTGTTEPLVTDNVTGLLWQGCPAGLTGVLCAPGTAGTYTWANALIYCDSLSWGGYTDWGLSDPYELQSIVDYGRTGIAAAYDPVAFPATPGGLPFWSSSSCAASPSCAWRVDFSGGSVAMGGHVEERFVRCVRRGP